jgi:hypothetical protein
VISFKTFFRVALFCEISCLAGYGAILFAMAYPAIAAGACGLLVAGVVFCLLALFWEIEEVTILPADTEAKSEGRLGDWAIHPVEGEEVVVVYPRTYLTAEGEKVSVE